ncbi:MAG TPA: SGNH/GDSL hydrolase family protein [Solirubrobacteraceae bacterium]
MTRPATRLVRLSALCAAVALSCAAGPAQAAAPKHYVALGDSYTAGTFIPRQYGEPVGCNRSDHNYPSLVQLQIRAERFVDESCSGAKTEDMTGPQRLLLDGVHAPQFDALTADADLVTIGIGGNDVGLVGAAVTCLVLGALNPTGSACRNFHARPNGADVLLDAIAATAAKVAATLQGIHQRSPVARVLIVGYPAVAPQTGKGCYPFVPLSDDDVSYLNTMLAKTNEMIAAQAAANDAEYVDTYNDSIGHDICTPPPARWFEGLVPAAPAFPIHPNAMGEASMARSVLRVLEGRSAPALSNLKRSRRFYRPGQAIELTYDLDRAASVLLEVRRGVTGRRSGGRCAPATRASRDKPACRRFSKVLRRVIGEAKAGANAQRLFASIAPRKTGLYRLTATAVDADDLRSAPQVVHFRIRR